MTIVIHKVYIRLITGFLKAFYATPRIDNNRWERRVKEIQNCVLKSCMQVKEHKNVHVHEV